ncbi:MAG: SURF1 family protein [Candidatus Competibacteraceae bacterium]|nr:SURF1 family protein [Candidatus Competibacteraceae bacterium]
MAIRLGPWHFAPSLAMTLLTGLLLALLVSLGQWQLDRARQKEVLLEVRAANLAKDPVDLRTLDGADPANRYRRVWVRGRYDTEHQVLLDNQLMGGRPGLHVLTPLRVEGAPWSVLVNRGWLPWGPERRLPQVTAPEGPLTLEGLVGRPANPGLQLAGTGAREGWPRLVIFVDYQALEGVLGQSLAPMVLLLDPAATDGYRRDWQLTPAELKPERHRGYALQWFSLGLALVVIFITVNSRRVQTGSDFEDQAR